MLAHLKNSLKRTFTPAHNRRKKNGFSHFHIERCTNDQAATMCYHFRNESVAMGKRKREREGGENRGFSGKMEKRVRLIFLTWFFSIHSHWQREKEAKKAVAKRDVRFSTNVNCNIILRNNIVCHALVRKCVDSLCKWKLCLVSFTSSNKNKTPNWKKTHTFKYENEKNKNSRSIGRGVYALGFGFDFTCAWGNVPNDNKMVTYMVCVCTAPPFPSHTHIHSLSIHLFLPCLCVENV